MPTPTTPTVVLARSSATSFTATVTSDSGTTNSLFYRRVGETTDTTGPTCTGSGTLTVSSLVANGEYLVYVYSEAGGYLSQPWLGSISLVLSDSVLAAILAKWSASPSLVTAAGPLFSSEVPETLNDLPQGLPYSVVTLDRSLFEWTFESAYIECTNIEFRIYTVGLDEAGQALALLRSTFDWQQLTFNTSSSAMTRPTNQYLTSTATRYKDASFVYMAEASYEVAVSRVA